MVLDPEISFTSAIFFLNGEKSLSCPLVRTPISTILELNVQTFITLQSVIRRIIFKRPSYILYIGKYECNEVETHSWMYKRFHRSADKSEIFAATRFKSLLFKIKRKYI